MEAVQKTPVEVVQELIALHTTRKEVSEKISSNGADAALAARAAGAAKKSDAAIAALMNELSQFGDGVGASVNRENAYQELYKQSIDDLNGSDSATVTVIYEKLEAALKTTYKELMDAQSDLPPTLQELIQTQYNELG